MSHDLRTPMNAIVGLCTLLNRDSNKPQKVEDYSRKITASSKHLLGLINDILDMSKIESGKVSVNTREFCLGELIDNINNIVRLKLTRAIRLLRLLLIILSMNY